MNELVAKACLVAVYESDPKRGYSHPVIAMGLALDVAKLGMGGLV